MHTLQQIYMVKMNNIHCSTYLKSFWGIFDVCACTKHQYKLIFIEKKLGRKYLDVPKGLGGFYEDIVHFGHSHIILGGVGFWWTILNVIYLYIIYMMMCDKLYDLMCVYSFTFYLD